MAVSKLRRGSVNRRLIIFILACSSLVTLIITAITLGLEYRTDINEIQMRLAEIEASYTRSVSQTVWQMDRDALQLQLDGIARLPDIVGVRVREEGESAVTEPEQRGDVIVKHIPLHYAQGEEQFALGELVVTVGLSEVYRRLWHKIVIIVTTQFIKTFVVSAAIFLIVQQLITRHLIHVAGHVRTLDPTQEGNALRLVRQPREDELSEVETAINWMTDTVRSKIGELDELNRNLERKVDERTGELAEAVNVLQTSERRFRDVAAQSGDWIWELDSHGRFTYSSPVVERVLGHLPEDLRGRPVWELFGGSDAEERATQVRDAMTVGKTLQGFECVCRGKHDELVIGELWMVPVREEQSGVVGYRGVLRDITERRRAEEELKLAHQKIVEASRLAGKAEIATGILHNMGNVLNGVTVSLSLLKEKVQTSKTKDLERVIAVAQARGEEFGQFISQDPKGKQFVPALVQLGSKLAGEHRFLTQEVELLVEKLDHIHGVLRAQQQFAKRSECAEVTTGVAMMEEALRLTGDAFSSKEIRIEKEFPDGLDSTLTVDRHKVLGVLTNLLLNAKDSVESAHGDPSAGVVTVVVTADADTVTLAVRDNGLGIDAENLVRVFRYGFTTKKKGHGFGLHASANAAGEIHAELKSSSEGLGKGAEFRLRLPRTPRPIRAGSG